MKKKINENTKITLTLGQLKKLVKESIDASDVETADGTTADFQEAAKELYDRGYVLTSSEWSTRDTRIWHVCYTGDGSVDKCREEVQSVLDLADLSSKGFELARKEYVDRFPRMVKKAVNIDCKWSCALSFPSEYSFDLKKFKKDTLGVKLTRNRYPKVYRQGWLTSKEW